jgi:protocatechuate 3,4-dioxygenase beta subunit
VDERGLSQDVPLLRRRRLLGLSGGTTVAVLSGALSGEASALVRSDIRRSFGTAKGVAPGVPLTIDLRLVGAATGLPAAGLAVYLWHADGNRAYSLYSPGLTGENYLRGVQPTDAAGRVVFTSVFPGDGRIHYEIYPSVAQATQATGLLLSGQLTLPVSPAYAYEGGAIGVVSKPSIATLTLRV